MSIVSVIVVETGGDDRLHRWLQHSRCIELFKTKCRPILLLYGLDAVQSISPRQLRSLNASEIVAEYLKLFGVSDVAEAVASRKDRLVKKYVLNSSVIGEIYVICS